jgi:hypothetical protein
MMLIIKQFLELLLLFVLEDEIFLPAPSLKPPPSTFLSHSERGNFTLTQELVTVTCSLSPYRRI